MEHHHLMNQQEFDAITKEHKDQLIRVNTDQWDAVKPKDIVYFQVLPNKNTTLVAIVVDIKPYNSAQAVLEGYDKSSFIQPEANTLNEEKVNELAQKNGFVLMKLSPIMSV